MGVVFVPRGAGGAMDPVENLERPCPSAKERPAGDGDSGGVMTAVEVTPGGHGIQGKIKGRPWGTSGSQGEQRK